MKIEKLLKITEGICINNPTQNEINSATIYSKKVEDGDLFIGSCVEDIKQAIKQGANAVIFDTDEKFNFKSDTALIRVDSIEKAAMKIIAYAKGRDDDLYFYLLKPHEVTFCKMILSNHKNVEYVPDEWEKAFELILNSQKAIFLVDSEELMKKIKPNIKKFDESAFGYNVEDTLFRSTFRVDKFVYQHKKMAPFHLSYLLTAVGLCQKHKLPYSIDRVNYTKHFIPIFIDDETHIQKEKINDHVVIVTDNLEDIAQGREYAKTAKVTMSKCIVFTPPKIKVESYTKPTIFRTPVKLVTAVKTTSFNFGFVYTKNREDLEALKEYFRVL